MLEITGDNFEKEVTQSKIPVVIDYWAPWCGPCKQLAPTFEKVSKDFAGMMKFVKCNIDENQAIAQEHGIMSIPCLVVFKNGKEVGRIVGNQNEEMLKQQLKALL